MAGLWSSNGHRASHQPSPSRQHSDLGPEPATLAEDLFLIMLDDATGRLRVQSRVAGYALAGALVVDLWALGNVAVGPGQIVILDRPPPADSMLKRTLGRLLAEPGSPSLSEWVEALGGVAVGEVADRLLQVGWLRQEQRGWLTGRHTVYPPVNRNAVFWRAGRLAAQLAHEPNGYDLALLGLVDAIGFTSAGLCDYSRLTRSQAVYAGARLGQEYPPVFEVTGHVRALAARAAISLR